MHIRIEYLPAPQFLYHVYPGYTYPRGYTLRAFVVFWAVTRLSVTIHRGMDWGPHLKVAFR